MVPRYLSSTLRGQGFLCFALAFALVYLSVRVSPQKTNFRSHVPLSSGPSSSLANGAFSPPAPAPAKSSDVLSNVRPVYARGNSYERESPFLVFPQIESASDERSKGGSPNFSFLSTGAWMTQRKLGKMFLSKVSAQMQARAALERGHLPEETREQEGEELAVWEGRGPRSWQPASDLHLEELGLTAFQPGGGGVAEKQKNQQQQEREETFPPVRGSASNEPPAPTPKKLSGDDTAAKAEPVSDKSDFFSLLETKHSILLSPSARGSPARRVALKGHPELRNRLTLSDTGTDFAKLSRLRYSGPQSPKSQPNSLLHSFQSPVIGSHRTRISDARASLFAQERRSQATIPASSPVSHLQVGATTQIIDALLATALSGGASALAQSGGLGGQQVVLGGLQPLALQGAAYPAPVMMPYAQPPPEPGLSTTEIVLIALGACVGVGILLAALYVLFCSGRRRRRR
ncbi:transmembrane protein [Cystoisospora suis]|uniref:Transmembrane protein n=1 Tax=Cystoisospora suis TaxID=483139 RepID=A0A2C6LD05_9APIC|nr:transmembrane protein [Cystoisospora suis]